MANRRRRTWKQTDLAARSASVSVATSSTPIAPDNSARVEVTIVNTSANIVDLAFGTTQAGTAPNAAVTVAPTAVAASGVRLAAGASYTTRAYTGPISGIAQTGASIVTICES